MTSAGRPIAVLLPVQFTAHLQSSFNGAEPLETRRVPADGVSSPAFVGLVVHKHLQPDVHSWLVSHIASGANIWPPGFPSQDLAVDFATRIGTLVDWRTSMASLRKNKPLQAVIQSLFL